MTASMTASFRRMKQGSAFQRRRQQGGTLAGLIVGLIIGLLVAVGVAMTIMKTPLPFVDKLGKQAQPAGELGDPNKTLPGGARERREHMDDAEPPSTPAAPASPPPPPAAVVRKPAEVTPAPPPTAPVTTPTKDNAPASGTARADKAAPATGTGNAVAPATPAGPPAASGGDAFTYYLQAGAFRELQDAEATKARLAMMGVAATIAERKSEIGTLYRVRVGPFAEVDAMNRARVRLSDNGVDAAVVRVPK